MPAARLYGNSKTTCASTVPTWRPPSWREPHHHPPDHEKECVGVEIDTPLMAACTFQHVVVLTGQIVRRPSRNLFTRSCVGASCLHAAKRSCLNRVSVCWNLAALSLHLTWRIKWRWRFKFGMSCFCFRLPLMDSWLMLAGILAT